MRRDSSKRSAVTASLVAALIACAPAAARADEPAFDELADEPGIALRVAQPDGPSSRSPRFRVELAFGYASLLVDPDVDEGYGGGIFIGYGLDQRVGFEASVYAANNPYSGQLGEVGGIASSFVGGNINGGVFIQLTRIGAPLMVTADLSMGAYLIVPALQEKVWSLGFAGGFTLAYRFVGWFGVGLKLRYHLYNLAKIAGPELVDIKAFRKVGVVDRLEVPGYVAFYF